MKNFYAGLVCMSVLVTSTVSAQADTKAKEKPAENYGALAKTSYIAFECSTLAMYLKDKAEGKRLFDYGYKTGKDYLAAWEGGKLNKDNNKEAPIAWTLVGGPSTDFILGQVSEIATVNISKNPRKAQELFNKAKCHTLGQ